MSQKTNTLKVIKPAPVLQTGHDLKNALLIVSVTANLFIFIAWLVIAVDPTVSLTLLQSR